MPNTRKHRSNSVHATLATAAYLFVTNPLDAQTVDEAYIERVRTALTRSLDDHRYGHALAIVHQGKVVLSSAAGYSDWESKTAIDANTLFPLGDVTRSISGIVAARLHSAGVIDLEAPAPFPVRDPAGIAHEIRLIDILDRTATVANFELFLRHSMLVDWPLDRIVDENLVLASGYGVQMPYAVLQHSAELRSERTWEQLVDEHVSKPYGVSSLVADVRTAIPENLAGLYGRNTGRLVRQKLFWSPVPAATGAWVTAEDLGALLQLFVAEATRGSDDATSPTSSARLSTLEAERDDAGSGSLVTISDEPGAIIEKVIFPELGFGWIYIGTSDRGFEDDEEFLFGEMPPSMPKTLDRAVRSALPDDDRESGHEDFFFELGGGPPVGKEDLVGRWAGTFRAGGKAVRVEFDTAGTQLRFIEIDGRSQRVRYGGTLDESLWAQTRCRLPSVHPRSSFNVTLGLKINAERDEFLGTIRVERSPFCSIQFPLRLKRQE